VYVAGGGHDPVDRSVALTLSLLRDGVKASPPRVPNAKTGHKPSTHAAETAAPQRTIAAVVVTLSLFGANRTFAQAERVGPGAVEVTLIPGGSTFFAAKGRSPSFGNYDLGGSLTYNFNQIVGVEGEAGGTLGISQNLQFGGGIGSVKTPNLVNYSGSVIVSVPTHSPVVPYVTGGVVINAGR
jgi:hypothetical protein